MKPVLLTQIVTKDKLIHQGFVFMPEGEAKRGIIWIHGLSSTFYNNTPLLESFVETCAKNNWVFASFNNRGHDLVDDIKKIDLRKKKRYSRVPGGAGNEVFKDCIYDIDAMIQSLVNCGVEKITLVGHSTGANKVCYWGGVRHNKYVDSIVLASPVSDRLDKRIDPKEMEKRLAYMRKLVNMGKGNELQLGLHFFPLTPQRFLSLFTPQSLEDQFDYGEKNPQLKFFSKIKIPVLVVIGKKDEFLDRKAQKVLDIFAQKMRSEKSKIVLMPKALHGFDEQENDFVAEVVQWVTQL